MSKFVENAGLYKGTWRRWHCGLSGQVSAMIACPECGCQMYLREYKILDTGHVTSQVNCEHPECDWIDDVTLEGW